MYIAYAIDTLHVCTGPISYNIKDLYYRKTIYRYTAGRYKVSRAYNNNTNILYIQVSTSTYVRNLKQHLPSTTLVRVCTAYGEHLSVIEIYSPEKRCGSVINCP